MIVRLVKMKFRAEEVDAFKNTFLNVAPKIRQFEGCVSVELLQDKNDFCTFFTRSIWHSEANLNTYRKSELFGKTWKSTKAKFVTPAQAWSTIKVD